MKKVAFLLFLVLSVLSCKKDKHEVANGAIFVKVEKSNGTVVPNAEINTSPFTESGKTNATGNLLINDVPVGIYEVTASHPSIGTGVGSVSVKEGDVTDVTIKLVTGVFVGPSVYISQPNNANLYVGDEIKFVAYASYDEQSPSTLAVEWTSSIDGVLNTDSPDFNGRISFVTSELSVGEHTITVKVTDDKSRTSESTIVLNIIERPEAVVLNEVEVLNGGLSLTWSAYSGADFVRYNVVRSNSFFGTSVVKKIEDINMTSYIDKDYILQYGKTYSYRIDVVVEPTIISESNTQEVIYEFEHIDVGTSISKMMDDPSRAYIYALDDENNELLFINKDSKTVEKAIYVGSSPKSMDMNDDFSKLYIANNGSSLVSVVDLNSQEKESDLQVETPPSYKPFSIVWLKGGYIAYSCYSDDFVRIANAQTGALVDKSISIYGKYIATNKAHDKLIVPQYGSLVIYSFNSGTLTEVASLEQQFGGFSKEVFVTSDYANIFVEKKKYATNNLDVLLGTFEQDIHAINFDGSIVAGSSQIFNGNMFTTIVELPFPSYVKVFGTDGKTLYSFHSNLKKIYITKFD